MSLAELRAIVGDAGADLTDEQLLRLDAFCDQFADVVVGSALDRADPRAGAARREQARLQLDRAAAPRRRRYERQRARTQAARRSA